MSPIIQFPIAAILTVTTGVNLTDDEQGVAALVAHLTGDCGQCTTGMNLAAARTSLHAQLPWTVGAMMHEMPEGLSGTSRQGDCLDFLAAQTAQHGQLHGVRPRLS